MRCLRSTGPLLLVLLCLVWVAVLPGQAGAQYRLLQAWLVRIGPPQAGEEDAYRRLEEVLVRATEAQRHGDEAKAEALADLALAMARQIESRRRLRWLQAHLERRRRVLEAVCRAKCLEEKGLRDG
ncbi:MAG: hypothetical protein RMJ84_11575, partial [Sandaracinaceae bacterium]|nr:hypothetical protein [Sandaracinaceae bacterium]